MSTVLLCDALRARLKTTLKDVYHPTDPSRGRDQQFKPPNVVDGWLAPKRNNNDDLPYVIVRPSRGKTELDDGRTDGTEDIKIIIGAYGEDHTDYKYCMVIKDRIVNDLLSDNDLASKWTCSPNISWWLPDEQADTVWVAEIKTTWDVPTSQMNEEDDYYVVKE